MNTHLIAVASCSKWFQTDISVASICKEVVAIDLFKKYYVNIGSVGA